MRVAFIADIHGNGVALDAVLEDIEKRKVDRIAVLGDIAFRGPEPKRVQERVRSLPADVIKGNADEWTARGVRPGEVPEAARAMMNREREWTAARLDEEDFQYLRDLPESLELELSETIRVHAFHATPENLFDVVLPETDDAAMKARMMRRGDVRLFVCAHIHLPYVRFIEGRCIVNTGSVGLPFDGLPQASYALVEADEDRFRVSIERVPYDVEKVVKQFRNCDYPNRDLLIRVVRNATSPGR
ncbi:putative phosphodiesterase [Planifilum fimeticola]|uniref:Putative phosphodiesterase n=1 Tax=Planifilum fimeticola TaxID=201975 RepID=A0A2T0LDL4_9BACL|nr:metallophosphoesterase family protein [Planifilum fimeticola]PRX39939.1 putative phosphodiesterase [Planifilum fimeticola]